MVISVTGQDSFYFGVAFAFQNSELLIQAASRLFKQFCHRIYKSSLYKAEGRYILVVYPLDIAEGTTAFFLGEYGEYLGAGEIVVAKIAEHGSIIIEDTAIDTLAVYLS